MCERHWNDLKEKMKAADNYKFAFDKHTGAASKVQLWRRIESFIKYFFSALCQHKLQAEVSDYHPADTSTPDTVKGPQENQLQGEILHTFPACSLHS